MLFILADTTWPEAFENAVFLLFVAFMVWLWSR